MWKKIKEILCKHTVYKDESMPVTSTIGSVLDLKSLPIQTETFHHNHRPYRKSSNHTLNKTDEHCRSLFNLLPTSLRPRHHHQQASNNKGIDASTTTTATTRPFPSIDAVGSGFSTDYDSGYMSQSVLNRTSSYASCYSAVATTTTTTPMTAPSTIARHGSIESLLYGHSKSNPANVHVLIRKNFEPFAQAHIGVRKGTIATALFSRGPWLYVRTTSDGQIGYIPRIICSLYHDRIMINNSKNKNKNSSYHRHPHLSTSSTDSSSNRDDEREELDLTIMEPTTTLDRHLIRPYKQQQQQQPHSINRYLSYSSAIINEQNHHQHQQQQQEHRRRRMAHIGFDERERRNTCTLPPPPPPTSTIFSSKDRRLTIDSVNWPSSSNKHGPPIGIHQIGDMPITTTGTAPPRDTDSSSTQDSGYSESTPYFLVQQATPDTEQPPAPLATSKKATAASPSHYGSVRRSSTLKIPDDSMNTSSISLRRHQPPPPPPSSSQSTRSVRRAHHRHSLLNGISMNDMITNDLNPTSSKRHSFGTFFDDNENPNQIPPVPFNRDATEHHHHHHHRIPSVDCVLNTTNNSSSSTNGNSSVRRVPEFAFIRNVRREPQSDDFHQRIKPSIHNLPKSHVQIPASIILNHHRQQQQQQKLQHHHQFGSSHSAFRPVQPTSSTNKHKRASSEGHSPSSEHPLPSSSLSSSPSSITNSSSPPAVIESPKKIRSNKRHHNVDKRRRLSCDLPIPIVPQTYYGSLTRSVCEQSISSTAKLTSFSRTMSDTLCDQFSELNVEAIEKDSLVQPFVLANNNRHRPSLRGVVPSSVQQQQSLFTITKDYRSSRASFSVKRGDCVYVLKQVGRACLLVRKHNNGQIGFLPRALMVPTTRIDAFLEMHGYRETVI